MRSRIQLLLLLLAGLPIPLLAQNVLINALAVPSLASPDSPTVTVTSTADFAGTPSDYQGWTFVFSSDSGRQVLPFGNGTASAVVRPNLQQSRSFVTVQVFAPFSSLPQATADAVIDIRPTSLPTALFGSYVFLLQGYAGNGPANEGAGVGSLTFYDPGDGTSKVQGYLDSNGKGVYHNELDVAGSYTLDVHGHGKVTLQSSAGTLHLDIFANVQQLIGSSTVSEAGLAETDGPTFSGSGRLSRQVGNPTQAGPGTPSLIHLEGEIAGSSGSLPVSLTGSLDYPENSATVDEVLGSYEQRDAAFNFSSRGIAGPGSLPYRTEFILSDPVQPKLPVDYVAYALDQTTFYVLSTDPVSQTVLLSGTFSAPGSPQP